MVRMRKPVQINVGDFFKGGAILVILILSVFTGPIGMAYKPALILSVGLVVVPIVYLFVRNFENIEFITTPEKRSRLRPPIPLAVRQRVLLRDGGRCRHCGSYKEPQIDHIIPYSRGGSDEVSNLQVLCGPCNRRKGNRYVG
jgi:HNH endonuclease